MIYFIFEFYTRLSKYFPCFRRLIWSLSWKSNDWGGLKFWTCLHATVLLAVKYSEELNKYILLVRVICEKYWFREQSNFPRAYTARISFIPTVHGLVSHVSRPYMDWYIMYGQDTWDNNPCTVGIHEITIHVRSGYMR